LEISDLSNSMKQISRAVAAAAKIFRFCTYLCSVRTSSWKSRAPTLSFWARMHAPDQGCQIFHGKMYQNGKNMTNDPKINQNHEIKQMNIEYRSNKAFQYVIKFQFWLWKYTIWQPCTWPHLMTWSTIRRPWGRAPPC
jgi:hypothetical protein